MAKYKVKADKVDLVKKAIAAFVEAVKRYESGTLAYEAFQEDATAFVHFMVFKNTQAERIHEDASYTHKFADVLYPNCDKAPIFSDLTLVGSNKISDR